MNGDVISTIGIVLSVLIAVVFSKDYVKNTVHNILVVLKAIHDYQDEKDMEKKLLSSYILNNQDVKYLSESSSKRFSDLERSLQCSITLFFWANVKKSAGIL